MNEIYTMDELAMCRNNQETLEACSYHVEHADIVIGEECQASLDLILDELGADFKRQIAYYILNSNDPTHSKAKATIAKEVNISSLKLALQLENGPF